jgi:parallel beta-helix repeat protein
MGENDEGAGLLVWKDSANYLRLDRMSRTVGSLAQQQIFFCGTIEGSFPIPGETRIVLQSNVNPTWLRLVRSGNVFSGYYSPDGMSWNHVADIAFEVSETVQVGVDIIIVYHTGAFFADFDYFRIYDAGHLWWNSNWQHRRKLNVTENSGYDLANFPIEVGFEHNGNVHPNGTDIRIIDGLLEIPSFVEDCNSTYAKVVFEINLTALESKTIYIYYGNLNATTPDYSLVPLMISEGNTGSAAIDDAVHIGWDYTSWGWSNNVELWNDFRIDFNKNNDPTDDNDLLRDHNGRNGGIGRNRVDLQAIGLGDYQSYVQTPIYVDVNFADAKLRVYRNHTWVETTQADHLYMFSPSWDYADCGFGSEQNIIDGENVTQITPSPPWHYPWNEMYISPVNPQWMAYRDSINGEIFGSFGLNIGTSYNYYFAAKEGSDWDRCVFYDFGTPDPPLEPYDQPLDCRICWYGDNSNNYTNSERIAAILNNQPTIHNISDTITVPDDYPKIQEAIDNANNGDTIFVRNGTYRENIVVNKTISLIGENRETTIIDGNKTGNVVLVEADGVTIQSFKIRNSGSSWYESGIHLGGVIDNAIKDDLIINNSFGIRLSYSSCNDISGNWITANTNDGIRLECYSSNNTISANNISGDNGSAIGLSESSDNIISLNSLVSNLAGSYLFDSWNNTIFGNSVTENDLYGINIHGFSSNTSVYNNNFVNNGVQAQPFNHLKNLWDDGYPSGGNYWSDYTGIDADNDGIGDSPYIMDANNTDNYPLMNLWTPPDIAVMNVTPSKNVVGQGFCLDINVTVANLGHKIENFDVAVLANVTSVGLATVMLTNGSSLTITIEWITAGFIHGDYSISACVEPILGETNISDNIKINGYVIVTVPGDINGDFTTNFLDAIVLGAVFRSKLYDPNWNPNADINNDGYVSFIDAIILGANFGQSWT